MREQLEKKKDKFRRVHFPQASPVHPHVTDSAEEMIQSCYEMCKTDPMLQKRSDFYFETQMERQLIPFVQRGLKSAVEQVQQENLTALDAERATFVRIFERFEAMNSVNEEKKELLGSDYVSESENEEELKAAFPEDELTFLEAHGIDLTLAYQKSGQISALKEHILSRYKPFDLTKHFCRR
jgi:hypothetical protein